MRQLQRSRDISGNNREGGDDDERRWNMDFDGKEDSKYPMDKAYSTLLLTMLLLSDLRVCVQRIDRAAIKTTGCFRVRATRCDEVDNYIIMLRTRTRHGLDLMSDFTPFAPQGERSPCRAPTAGRHAHRSSRRRSGEPSAAKRA